MNFSGSAPVRQPSPDLQEQDLPELPEHAPKAIPESGEISQVSSENSIKQLRLLWEHRTVLSLVALCGFLGSTLLAFLIPMRFESTARLMPPDNSQSGGLAMAAAALSGGASGVGGIASEMLGLKSTSEIFVGILSSRTVEDKLIQQFDLRKLYGASRMEDARLALSAHTAISVDRKSQIITVTVTDHDPKRSAAMGQAYIEELNRLVAELSTSSARRERLFLEERLRAVTKDLESAERDFSQFSSKNAAIDIKEQGKAMVEAAAALQGELIAAESQLEGVRQIYTDNNVRVRSVRARIEELKRQIEKIGGKAEDASASEPHPDSPYPSIRKLPLLGVAYADLYRRTRVQEAVFETLTKEYELAKVQEAKEIPTVKVLDSPNVPDKKSFPPRTVIVLLGTAAALAFGTTWIFGKVSWARMDSADPRKAFASEVFATVKASLPKFSQNGSESRSPKQESIDWIPQPQDKARKAVHGGGEVTSNEEGRK